MRQYLPFFGKYRKALILAPALVILDVLCEIVQPELMSKIVDNGVGQKSMSYILHTGGIMLGLSLVAITANIGNIYYSSHASVGFAAELRKGLYNKILKFSFSNLDRLSSASLVTRMTNDINILQDVTMMSLRLLIRAPLMLLFAVIIAVRINAGLASIIGVAIPVLGVSIYLILRKGLPFFEKVQKKLDKVNVVIQENLVNVRVVKSFVREDFEVKKFACTNDELREMSVKASGTVVLIMPVMQLVMNLSIVAIVWFGGNKIISGSFQVGQLMSFITYITQILMSLMMLSMTIMSFSRAGASVQRTTEVLKAKVDIIDSPAAVNEDLHVTRGKIEFEKVFFKYHADGSEFVLRNISFTVLPGETAAIIGATGSSKSTLVQLIPRLYDVTLGRVLVDDRDVRDYPVKNLRSAANLVIQQNELFSGSIRDNLKWGNVTATEKEIIAASRDAQAHDFIMTLPRQYDTVLGQGGVNLSGGQKQRICIARAILGRPVILILDDSTSAVDVATEAAMRQSFRNHLAGTTVLIIAQRISSIQAADKIILVDNGEIAGIGRHDELMKNCMIYREIYLSQQLQKGTAG